MTIYNIIDSLFVGRYSDSGLTALSIIAVQRAIKAQDCIIRKIADNGSCVIVGRAADYVLLHREDMVRVFVHAPKEYRIGRVREIYGDTFEEAKRNIRRSDKARESYYRHISGKRWGDARYYELTMDSSVGVEKTADMILQYVANHREIGQRGNPCSRG